MEKVYKLVHDEYVKKGYCQPQQNQQLIHYPHLDDIPETSVFIVEENNIIIGTNSLTIDGKNGLNSDKDFPKETHQIRQTCQHNNHILASSWRMAISSEVRNNLTILLSLIGQTIETAIQQNAYMCLFILNPKHEKFYHKILGLDTVSTGVCESVGATAVLMKTTAWDIAHKWKALCQKRKMVDNIDITKIIR